MWNLSLDKYIEMSKVRFNVYEVFYFIVNLRYIGIFNVVN